MNHEKKYAGMEEIVPIIEERIGSGKEVRITVTGNSMVPMLRHRRDSVVLKRAENLNKYDIPLYRRENGIYVLHRIIKKKGDTYYIAGDNETSLEYPVKKEQVIAVVSGFYRKGKYYSNKNSLYKIYVWLWCAILPYRHKILPKLLGIKRKIGGLRAKKQK